jgi:hypothetical protein
VSPDNPAASSHLVNPLHIPRRGREGISSGANIAQDSQIQKSQDSRYPQQGCQTRSRHKTRV